MTHENLDESTKRAIELKVRSELLIESIGKYSKGEIKELVAMVDSENFKGIEAQCQQIKKLFEQIFEQNLRLVLITFYQNNIPKEEIESFLEDIRVLQVNYDLLLDSMLNKIKSEAIFLERKADVMPSIVGSKNGKLNHQKSKEIKKDIQSFAKERWEKD
ncbi:TPA: hypothetical protein QB438_001821, partial [Pasteurella multocida]|nr:hypothetical protein [Pasteurella multocida]